MEQEKLEELTNNYSTIKGFYINYYYYEYYFKVKIFFPNGAEMARFNLLHQQTVEQTVDFIKRTVYTEEEILSKPIASMKEFELKKRYLKEFYHLQIPEYKHPRLGEYYGVSEDCIYDPISGVYFPWKYEEFVKHHIWLSAELHKALPPTIFEEFPYSQSRGERFASRYQMLSYADENDPNLPSAREYVQTYAKDFVMEVYPKQRIIPLRLVQEGYIKKPTMKKLLEKANETGDTEMVAILLEKMNDGKKAKSTFSL